MHSERTGQGYSEREKEGRKEGREGRRVGGKERQTNKTRKERQTEKNEREGGMKRGRERRYEIFSVCFFKREFKNQEGLVRRFSE